MKGYDGVGIHLPGGDIGGDDPVVVVAFEEVTLGSAQCAFDDQAEGFVGMIQDVERFSDIVVGPGAILGEPLFPGFFADFGERLHDGGVVIGRNTEAAVMADAVVDEVVIVAGTIGADGRDAPREVVDALMDKADELTPGVWQTPAGIVSRQTGRDRRRHPRADDSHAPLCRSRWHLPCRLR